MFQRGFSKVYILLIALVFVLIVWKFDELRQAVLLWRDIKWYYLFLAVFLQFLSYGSMAGIFHSLVRILGHPFGYKHMFKVTTVLNFFNRAMPSLGISGGAYLVSRLHKDGFSRGKALIVAVLFYTNFYLAFFILLVIGFVYLFARHDVGQAEVMASMVAVGVVVVFYAFIFFVVSDRTRFFAWSKRILGLISRINRRLEGVIHKRRSSIIQEIEEVYTSWRFFWRDFGHMKKPLVFSLAQHMVDIATIYVIFLGFQYPVPIGVITVGYVTANIFSFISLVPNGIGVYEASMVLLFNGLQVPLPVALSGVLAFRVLFYWLPIPVGIYFYRHFVHHDATQLQANK